MRGIVERARTDDISLFAAGMGGITVLSALLLYVNVGTNLDQHYATSGLAVLVLVAVWLFLANVLLLVGYKVAQESN